MNSEDLTRVWQARAREGQALAREARRAPGNRACGEYPSHRAVAGERATSAGRIRFPNLNIKKRGKYHAASAGLQK
jgi:hypothetical protein